MRATAQRSDRRPIAAATLATLAACALVLLLAPSAASAAPPLLWQKCDVDEPVGQRCSSPSGVAADPDNGHVFLSDTFNSRVAEFNALGDFVKAWGWDVVASGPGDDTVAPEDEFEICVPEDGDVCKAGVGGSGEGQFDGAPGVAIDSAGSVYINDFFNDRVQKFDRQGHFLLMFGGEVNKTKVESGAASEEEENLCPFDPGDECQAGTAGTGNGQFKFNGNELGDVIAIDDGGTAAEADDNVYVGDENRIQRFNTDGVYQGEIFLPDRSVQSLAVDASGNLYFSTWAFGPDVEKVSPSGESLFPAFEIPDPDEFTHPDAVAVAVDAAGHVYAFSSATFGNGFVSLDQIFEFDPAGNLIDQFGKGEFEDSKGLATNLCEGSEAPGNLYVTNPVSEASGKAFLRAYGTDPTGCFKARTLPASGIAETSATLNGTVDPGGSAVLECRFQYGTSTAYGGTVPCAESSAEIGSGEDPVPVHADLAGLQRGTVYHFRLRATIVGTDEVGADETFKTFGPPVVSEDHTASVTYTEARPKALVNPEGFATTCEVQYGQTASYGQSSGAVPVGADRSEHAHTVTLEGLTPGTTYHWRLFCTNASDTTASEDHVIHTYRLFSPQTDCPNQATRGGDSAYLPDCRAYEMVSPVDKNGGDIINALPGGLSGADPGGYVQVAPDGDRLTYASRFPAFGDQPTSNAFNQYLATRTEGAGWASHGINLPYLSRPVGSILVGVLREFIAFSPDLCNAWRVDYQTPPLNPDAQEEAANLYRRDNCGPAEGTLETLTTSPAPPGEDGTHYVNRFSVQGISEDSRHALFVAAWKLTDDAAPGDKDGQIYDRHEGALHLVSVLPNGNADTSNTAVGSGWGGNLDNAVSRDGSRAYWTSQFGSGVGRIYLRLHPEQGIVNGECTKATKACTLPVSATSKALYWSAAADGSAALYSEGGKLLEYDLPTKASRLIADGVEGVAGASDDLSRIYFVSSAILTGAQQNSEGDQAQAGEPNLYLDENGTLTYVATFLEGDVGFEPEPGAGSIAYDLVASGTYHRATRVSPDGSRIAFHSRASLTHFDNFDPPSGRPLVEVFAYEAGGELLCVSCNPSGARPVGRDMTEPYNPHYEEEGLPKVSAAAWIPTWEHPNHASNVLSENGNRLFFNSNDPLLARDTNGAQDLYEWQELGSGSCEAADPEYFPQNDGCIHLISSGENPFESEFWGASPDGEDVFFTTGSSLASQDPGSIDLYDARVGGGLPAPVETPLCEGEACQSPPGAPDDPTPASAAIQGPGNAKEGKPRRRCPRGQRRVVRRGKARCAAKQRKRAAKQQRKRRANANRRAAR